MSVTECTSFYFFIFVDEVNEARDGGGGDWVQPRITLTISRQLRKFPTKVSSIPKTTLVFNTPSPLTSTFLSNFPSLRSKLYPTPCPRELATQVIILISVVIHSSQVRTKDRQFSSVQELVEYHVKNALPIISSGSQVTISRPVHKH